MAYYLFNDLEKQEQFALYECNFSAPLSTQQGITRGFFNILCQAVFFFLTSSMLRSKPFAAKAIRSFCVEYGVNSIADRAAQRSLKRHRKVKEDNR